MLLAFALACLPQRQENPWLVTLSSCQAPAAEELGRTAAFSDAGHFFPAVQERAFFSVRRRHTCASEPASTVVGKQLPAKPVFFFFFFLKAITFSLESLCYLENICLKCDTVFASRSHFSCCFPGILAESSRQAIMCSL